jgi:small conductance mechanosensitive channel
MDWSLFFNGQEGVILPLWNILIHFVIAITIAIVGVFMGRAFGRVARGIVERLELTQDLDEAGVKFQPEMFAENIVKYIVYIASFIAALNYLGITPVIFNILFVAMIIIVVLAIFLSLKDFVPNIISGIYVISINKIRKGDNIKVNGVSGIVTDISLTETTLLNNGNKIIMPNSTIMKNQIIIQKPTSKKKTKTTSRKKK